MVDFEYTNDIEKVREWLIELEKYSVIACDFETAVKYSEEDYERFRRVESDSSLPRYKRKLASAALKASAINSHPEHCVITHFSVAWSTKDSYVVITDTPELRELICSFLTTTNIRQVWHNAGYDFKFIKHNTNKLPKNYEDTLILARTLLNNVKQGKNSLSLKALAAKEYGDWALSGDDFKAENIYNPQMIRYAAIDSCATMWIYERMMNHIKGDFDMPDTNSGYSPWSQLPSPVPRDSVDTYPEGFFYHNTAKHLINDTVRIMMNGLPIDLKKVEELETELTSILLDVQNRIDSNPLVQQFQKLEHSLQLRDCKEQCKRSMRSVESFLVKFNPKNIAHRSYYMEVFAQEVGLHSPSDELPCGTPKWSAALVKKLSSTYRHLNDLLDGTVPEGSPRAIKAMFNMAAKKAERYNQKYLERIKTPDLELIPFNPGSSQQKQKFFAWLGEESETISERTGNDSWSRAEVERLNAMTPDEGLVEFTSALIDHSYASIVKSNFINAFYSYTVNGRLHGNYNLLGALSGRFTSNSPNMQNTPSSRSIFSKPVKRCFTAPEGYIVGTIDYSGLEDVALANLTLDNNKLAVLTEGLDGHCMASYFYRPEEVGELLPEKYDDMKDAVRAFKKLVDEGDERLKNIRSGDKQISFGLAYGCGPAKVAKAIKGPLERGVELHRAYHQDLYPQVTAFREEYILPTVLKNQWLHLGLGFRLYSDNPNQEIRTLNNASFQFWSILAILTINKLHQLIDEKKYENDIQVTATIHDSIYFIIRDDVEIIKWLNDVLVPVMTVDYIENQTVPNSAELEIGPDWAEVYPIRNNATEEEIKEVRSEW